MRTRPAPAVRGCRMAPRRSTSACVKPAASSASRASISSAKCTETGAADEGRQRRLERRGRAAGCVGVDVQVGEVEAVGEAAERRGEPRPEVEHRSRGR